MSARKVIVIVQDSRLSAAISLAQEGSRPSTKERKIGGKLNVLKEQGYSFDLGPSILTLRTFFGRLFERSGRRCDYIPIRALRRTGEFFRGRQGRGFCIPSRRAWRRKRRWRKTANVERFLKYSADLYDLVDAVFRQGLDTSREFRQFYAWAIFSSSPVPHHARGVKRFLQDAPHADIFDYFIKYRLVGV